MINEVSEDIEAAEISGSLAVQIASVLEQEIISSGWRIGARLGLEIDLAKRFEVGRWVMREALAITQRDGLTEMRRGRNGGVYVSAPPANVVATTMRNYLLFAGVTSSQLLQIKRELDGIACTLAVAEESPQLLEQSYKLLAEFKADNNLGDLSHCYEIYRQVLRLSNNRLVQVFGETLSQLAFAVGICIGSPEFVNNSNDVNASMQLWHNRIYQLERALAGDLSGALQAAGVAHNGIQKLYEAAPTKDQRFILGDSFEHTRAKAEQIINVFPSQSTGRRQETLVLQIQLDTLRLNYLPGSPVGSEDEMMEIYGVGRNVLREAIRMLERDQVVVTTVGRNGGLCIAAPSFTNILRKSVMLLQFMGVSTEEAAPMIRVMLGLACEQVALKQALNGAGLPQALADFFADANTQQLDDDCLRVELLRAMVNATDMVIFKLFAQILVDLHNNQTSVASINDERESADSDTDELRQDKLQRLQISLVEGDALAARRSVNRL